MRLLINFSTLKSGGGQNVALNFLHATTNFHLKDVEFFFLVARNSDSHLFLIKNGYKDYLVSPSNPLIRILFELFFLTWFVRIKKFDAVYSYFGFCLIFSGTPQISGSADSNLFFPEINFWKDFKGLSRIKKYLIDSYRIFGLQFCDAIIFENEIMEERAKALYGIKCSCVVMPSINMDYSNSPIKIDCGKDGTGLFLCGWQMNKNVMLIPLIAQEIKKRGLCFKIVLTAPTDTKEFEIFSELLLKHDVRDFVIVIGSIKKEELHELYTEIDVVFLLSKLESFSNNIIEAWYFSKPLVVSDELWARSICKDSATYVDRDSPVSIADAVVALINDKALYSERIENGKKLLSLYPGIEQRIINELAFIKNVIEIF